MELEGGYEPPVVADQMRDTIQRRGIKAEMFTTALMNVFGWTEEEDSLTISIMRQFVDEYLASGEELAALNARNAQNVYEISAKLDIIINLLQNRN